MSDKMPILPMASILTGLGMVSGGLQGRDREKLLEIGHDLEFGWFKILAEKEAECERLQEWQRAAAKELDPNTRATIEAALKESDDGE